jgi:acyl carrier protein
MNEHEIRGVLAGLAKTALGWEGPLPETSLSSNFSSMQIIAFVVAIEDRFGLRLDPADAMGIDTMPDLINLIRRGSHDRQT